MKIQDWFDVNNPEHIEAFSHLEKHGVWPVGFVPNYVNIDCSICWQVMLYAKLAGAYIADFKKKQAENKSPLTFEQGYVCAVATLLRMYGSEVEAKELMEAMGAVNWENIEEYDKEILNKFGLGEKK